MYRLCISQNIYLEEIIKEEEWINHIGAIRSLETARFLQGKVPKNTININKLLNTPLQKDNEEDFSGWAYWALAEGIVINEDYFEDIVISLSKEENLDLFKLLKPFLITTDSCYWENGILSQYFEAAILEMEDYLLIDGPLLMEDVFYSINDAIFSQSINLTRFFLGHINKPIDAEHARAILGNCLKFPHEIIIPMVFSHPSFKHYISQISIQIIEDVTRQGREDIISLLIQYPLDENMWEGIFNVSIKYRRSSITQLLLNNKPIKITNSHLRSCLTYSNLDSFKMLLNVVDRMKEEDEYLFRDALYSGKKDFVKVLLEHLSVNKDMIPIRYIKEAKKLLKEE